MYEVTAPEKPKVEDYKVLEEGINENAFERQGFSPKEHHAIYIKDEHGKVSGGIGCRTGWNFLFLEKLWLSPKLRGRGYGKKLLEKAEIFGIEKGCRFAALSTMDFEARDFYEKNGYEIEYIRRGYSGAVNEYFFKKKLAK